MKRVSAILSSRTLTALLLAGIVAAALYGRLWHLTPPARGILYAPDTDEGAYAFSAQLLLQGELPYRDFFATLPPGGLYLFAAVLGVFYHPWGSLESFMALRYANILLGTLTVLVVYAVGRRVGGRWAGLLAAAVLAVDGIVIGQDRRAMLETPMNLFSALAIWAYLEATLREKSGRRLLALAGAFSATAVMIKSPGALVPILLVATTLLRRRWGDLIPLVSGGIAAGLLLAAPFLILCPQEFIKQVYVFQFVRPPDGVISTADRLQEIWGYPYSWLTLRLSGLGAVIALWKRWREPEWAGWLVILAWAGLSLALMVFSRSYWGTYFPQLAVPLALLAGGALTGSAHPTAPFTREPWGRLLPALALALFFGWGLLFQHFATQLGATRVLLGFSKPAFAGIAGYLEDNSRPGEAILATDPLYGMLASLPQARRDGDAYLADSYGGMLYENLGLAGMTWGEIRALSKALETDPIGNGELATLIFHRPPAQTQVLNAFAQARYVVIDRRARRQWAPETIALMEKAMTPVLTIDDATLYMHDRNLEHAGG